MADLPSPRTGQRVTFRTPKNVGGTPVAGTVLDEVWCGPYPDPWGEYALFSELIEWDGGTGKSIRMSYYYRPQNKSHWIFGGQYCINGTPAEVKELIVKTLGKAHWFA